MLPSVLSHYDIGRLSLSDRIILFSLVHKQTGIQHEYYMYLEKKTDQTDVVVNSIRMGLKNDTCLCGEEHRFFDMCLFLYDVRDALFSHLSDDPRIRLELLYL